MQLDEIEIWAPHGSSVWRQTPETTERNPGEGCLSWGGFLLRAGDKVWILRYELLCLSLAGEKEGVSRLQANSFQKGESRRAVLKQLPLSREAGIR